MPKRKTAVQQAPLPLVELCDLCSATLLDEMCADCKELLCSACHQEWQIKINLTDRNSAYRGVKLCSGCFNRWSFEAAYASSENENPIPIVLTRDI